MVDRAPSAPRRSCCAVVALVAWVASACATGPRGYQRYALCPAAGGGPRVLGVTAHPDDEIAFAATFYKTATQVGGACDLFVITNGEAGYRYSTLAELIYDLPLTDPEVGRARLPAIRRQELLEGCRLLRLRQVFMLGEKDHRNTRDPNEVLAPNAGVWDLDRVRAALRDVLAAGHYDFVLTHQPVPETHGHHQAASILALEAVAGLPPDERPVVLATGSADKDDATKPAQTELAGFPITRVHDDVGPFVFDRAQKFGREGKLNYQIVVNWAIAEHKSQGTMQNLIAAPGVERFWMYALDVPGARERAAAWFAQLAVPPPAASGG